MNFNASFLKLNRGKTFFQTLVFLVVVFLVSALPVFLGFILKLVNPSEYGINQGIKDLEITYKELLFFLSMVLALFVLSASFKYIQKKWMKTIFVFMACLYLFIACFLILADIIYYLIFSYRLTFSVVQTVLNTNPDEAKDFIKLYISVGNSVTIILFIVFMLWLVKKRKWFVSFFSTRSFFITALLFSIFGIIDFATITSTHPNGLNNIRYGDIIAGYNQYLEFNRTLQTEKNNYQFSKEYDTFYKNDTLQKTLVLLVSESLSKRHMSLYGYPRKTTPNLDTNKSIYVFNNCVTMATLTQDAVPNLFSREHLDREVNLITLLNKLGYTTWWISNQSGWGRGDKTIVAFAQLCSQNIFTDKFSDDDKSNLSRHYDEEILKHFNKAMSESQKSSRFIVLHLMACHFDYDKRYPKNRNFYTSVPPAKTAVSSKKTNEILNSYDNAMHYHDSVVNQILTIFSKHSQNKNAALVFLSDHGEELFENRNFSGHTYPASRLTSEIPYFTLLSDDFKKNFPEIETNMMARKNTPYSTADNFFTMLQLLNINSKTYNDKIQKNGFFDSAYDSTHPRMVMGDDYSTMK